jgi:hypothetical protein
MSKVSRQRLRELKQHPRKKKLRWILPLVVFALIAAGVFVRIHLHPSAKKNVANAPHDPSHPQTLNELLALSPAELDKVDIGLMNLLCADSLLGSENLDIQDCLKKLDGLAAKAKFDTDRHFYRFREHPEQFRNSLGYFQMMMLDQVLVQDLGIQYKPDLAEYLVEGKAPTYGVFNSDSKNIFIHGLLNGSHYGTCASMPVLLAAVAHRLGYPVNLAGTKLHLYARYEDYNGKHFNIEPTVTEGFLTPSDDEYKTEQFTCTEEEIKEYGWLRPYSHAEILNQFLYHRGICLGMAKRYQEATEIILKSEIYAPDTPLNRKHFQRVLENLKNAPLGDKIDDWRQQIQNWEIPKGARTVYFENRKIQLRYFVGLCPDATASQRAVDDLKAELAEYARQMTLTNPAPEFLNPGQHILDLTDQAGRELRLPVSSLPPPLNNGATPPEYLNCLRGVNFDNGGAVMDALWQHYQDVTRDWSGQPPLLLPHWQETGTSFPISPLTAH